MAVAASTHTSPVHAPETRVEVHPGGLDAPVRVVSPPPAPRSGIGVLAVVGALLGGLVIAGVRMEHRDLGYQREEVGRRLEEARDEQARLAARLAELRAPDHLGPAAAALGLHAPDPGQIHRVEAP